MAIAYDTTRISNAPIRWEMPHILTLSGVLGFFSIVQSFGLLLVGFEIISDPQRWNMYGLTSHDQLQTVMFLQLVAGGHLLLFVTRTSDWFFFKPYPATPLFSAIVVTQAIAVAMCIGGWLVAPISWRTVAAVWAYNIVWMFAMSAVRISTENLLRNRTSRRRSSIQDVTQHLMTAVRPPPPVVRS
jgi:H+-transporting ATPase